MNDLENGGASAEAPESPMPASLSIEAAAEMLSDEGESGNVAPQPEPEALAEQDASDVQAEAAADPAPDEAAPAEVNEPERDAHGNQFVNLRNGERVRVADLKKEIDDAREITKRFGSLEGERAKIQQAAQRIMQQAQSLEKMQAVTAAILQRELPKEPDASLLESDPVEYLAQMSRFNLKKKELDQLVANVQSIRLQGQQGTEQQRKALEAQELQRREEFLKEQGAALSQKMPELKNPERAKQFHEEFIATGMEYGFTPDELNSVYDHRLLLLARDANAYRKLQKNKPIVDQKVKSTAQAPTQQPARRVPASEAAATERQRKIAQAAKKPGGFSIEEAMAFL